MMWTHFIALLTAVSVMLTSGSEAALAQALQSQKTEGPDESRKSCFSIGLMGQRHSLKASDGNELIGNSAAVQLGSGYISESWYVLGAFDILLGPNEPVHDKQLNVDFVGTGISLWTGISAQNRNLRSQEGSYGFALGLAYSDSVGRSVGRNRKEPSGTEASSQRALDTENLIDEYSIRVSNLSLMPAMFFAWLLPARPRGNTPELLKTRLDGYFLTVGVALPVLVNYQARYQSRSRPDPRDPQKRIAGGWESERGKMNGYSIQIALTAMLGT